MRSFIATGLALAAACAFGVTMAAQGKEHTMGGCLQKGSAEGSYVVMNAAEKGPKVIGIVSSKDNLAPHVGHHIDITGTAVPNDKAAAMKNAPKADHYMDVTAIKMVSATCK